MKLSDGHYSKKETALFGLIPKAERSAIESKALVAKYYGGSKKVPFHGQQSVMAGVRTLKNKIEYYKEPFRLRMEERRGPHPIKIWLEARS
jgi:hypothetical protein